MPEPELMLDELQAVAYAAADFDAPHGHCLELLRARLPELASQGRAIDLGCGPGDITLRLARALPEWRIDGVDGSPAMLRLAEAAGTRAGLAARLAWHLARLPDLPPIARAYDLVVSNSLLHHLADPSVLWSSILRCGEPATRVFVMDLLRPDSDADARMLVRRYAAGEPEVLRRDFYHSLRAAYRPAEIRRQIAAAGLDCLAIEIASDRHVVIWGRLP